MSQEKLPENDPLDEMRRMAAEIRENLEEGGPAVNYELVVAYVDGRLEGNNKDAVGKLIWRYKNWNDAYREVSLTPTPEIEEELNRMRQLFNE